MARTSTCPKNTTVEGTVHLLFISTASAEPAVSHPRVLVVAEDNVEATIVESYVGQKGVYWTNAVTEIVCGADCRIDHCKLQHESLHAYHVATMQVRSGEGRRSSRMPPRSARASRATISTAS